MLAVTLSVAAALSLQAGSYPLEGRELLAALLGNPGSDAASAIVWELRVPRLLLSVLVGAALACAGAAMQGLFRNPLADPGLVGVSSGAALAAVGLIVAGPALALPPALAPFATPLAAFAGGLAAAALAARLSRAGDGPRTATLLLAGLAINAIAGAGVGLLLQMAGDAALRESAHWLFGSLAKAGWTELVVGTPLLIASLMLLPREARALNALLLGEDQAQHLGVSVDRLRRRLMALIVIAVGTSVALTGVIGFIGLIVPHLLRGVLGPDHRGLLPACALGGAVLLTLADIGARTALPPAEIPVGILTSLIGGPFFLALLLRLRGRIESP